MAETTQISFKHKEVVEALLKHHNVHEGVWSLFVRFGLGAANVGVTPEELMPATYELARKLADGPPMAIRLAKRALYHNQDVELRAALEFETFAQNVCRETEDAREGIRAFVEKRPPRFQGR